MSDDRRQCERVQSDPQGAGWSGADRAHAAACPECAAWLGSVEALDTRLRAVPGLAAPMPGELKARLLAKLAACPAADERAAAPPVTAAPARPARREPLRFPRFPRFAMPAALAASLALGVVIGSRVDFGSLPSGEVRRDIGNYINDVTHDHLLFSRVGRPLEVAMTDPAPLSAWLSESLNFRVGVPRGNGDFRLEGGRLWHTVGRLSSLAAYDVGGGRRALLFAVPAANIDLKGAPSSIVRGRRVFSGSGWNCDARVWIDGDLAMALVAPTGTLPASWAETFLP